MQTKKTVQITAKECPFCGSTNIDVSVKRKATYHSDKHHVCCYCKDCYTYGPRVLVDDEKDGVTYGWANANNLPEHIINKAVELWNKRS